jgi:hypothetical protein
VLAEAARQEALGWRLAARPRAARVSRPASSSVRATGPDGTPLDGLTVTGQLTRPIDAPASVGAALVRPARRIARVVALPRAASGSCTSSQSRRRRRRPPHHGWSRR